MNAKPITENAKLTRGQKIGLFFLGAVFLAAGIALCVGIVLLPYLNAQSSLNWPEVPCKVLSSEVEVHRGDDSVSYSVGIEYSYEVGKRSYQCDRYEFNVQSKKSKRECGKIVAKYLEAGDATCFVDPDNPESAVIDRHFDLSWGALIAGAILSVIGLGVSLIPLGLFTKKKRAVRGSGKSADASGLGRSPDGEAVGKTNQNLSGDDHPASIEDRQWDVPQRLKPEGTRIGKLVGMLFVALFWNGIVSVFVWQGFAAPLAFFSLFLGLFLIPFVLIGLLLIAGVVSSFLSLFSPVIEIATSTGAVGRGQTIDLAWEVKGNASWIRRLQIAAVGTEHARYQQGTNTRTDTSDFLALAVADVSDQQDIAFGSGVVTIPVDTMHTFADTHNQISWAFQVKADIKWWPDVSEKHVFRVKP